MKIVGIGLLLSACGIPPQTGRVYSDASPELLLGLAQNHAGAYEFQLCKDTARGECINPLMTAAGEAYSFHLKEKSWLTQGVRYGVAGLAGIIGGVAFFKGARYLVRRGAATDLAREVTAAKVEEGLVDKELPEALRRALRRGRLNRDDARKLLTLLDQHSIDIEQEADFLATWDKHVAELHIALRRYSLNGNWHESALRHKLEQLDAQVRKVGRFRTADELHAMQGKERRAAHKELRQRIAELRRDLRSRVKTQAVSLEQVLRKGESTRKAAQGRFAWFNYKGGGERVIDRAQVLDTLMNGQQPDAIAVRVGLEKLAAQLTGATIFVALVLPSDSPSPKIEPLLQRIAQAVDARITPPASCLLGVCGASD